ncbi:ATP-dependent DNA ligase [Streptomyces griseicoloratus]|uniref:ATP-dependent DNA ligase n=1 Tax=Streptomyces griseicoloratus TaxID=2752516 RepID=UPI00359C74D5
MRRVLCSTALWPHPRRWDQWLRDLPQPVRNNPTPRAPPHDLTNEPPPHGTRCKWDGYRAQLARWADGRVLLRSRQGTDMTASFPEILDAALAQLPYDTGLDGVM